MLSNNRTRLIVWWMANVFVFVLVMIWSLAQLVSVCLVEGQWVSTQWAQRWGYVCKEVWMPWYMTPIALQILLMTWAIFITSWVGASIYTVVLFPEVARLMVRGHIVAAVKLALDHAFSKRKT